MTISAYPLQWPAGWGRTGAGLRKTTAFKRLGRAITVAEAVERVREELRRMGHGDNDVVVHPSELFAHALDRLCDGDCAAEAFECRCLT